MLSSVTILQQSFFLTTLCKWKMMNEAEEEYWISFMPDYSELLPRECLEMRFKYPRELQFNMLLIPVRKVVKIPTMFFCNLLFSQKLPTPKKKNAWERSLIYIFFIDVSLFVLQFFHLLSLLKRINFKILSLFCFHSWPESTLCLASFSKLLFV